MTKFWFVVELIKLNFYKNSFRGLTSIVVQKPWYGTCGMIPHLTVGTVISILLSFRQPASLVYLHIILHPANIVPYVIAQLA